MATLKLIRTLDGILIGLVGLLIFVPQLLSQPVLASGRGLLYITPIMLLAFISFRVPRRFEQIPEWDRMVLGLRAFALAWVGLSPLVVWWLASQTALYPSPGAIDNVQGVRVYFSVNAILAVLAATGWLMHVNWMVQRLSVFCDVPALELEAAMNRWLLLIGTMSLSLVALVMVIIMKVPLVELVGDYVAHWGKLVVFLMLLPCLPILLVTTMVLRLRFALNTHIESQFERYALDELAHRTRMAEQSASTTSIVAGDGSSETPSAPESTDTGPKGELEP